MATMEDSVEIPLKMEIELSYDPAIPLLGIHTEETQFPVCISHFNTELKETHVPQC